MNCIEGGLIFKATQEERMMGYRFNKEEYLKRPKRYILIIQPMFPEWEELDRLQKENPKASLFRKNMICELQLGC
ncbi:MAG: hypothetical protein ACLSEY_14730 [Enterocloster sp.]